MMRYDVCPTSSEELVVRLLTIPMSTIQFLRDRVGSGLYCGILVGGWGK